MITVAQRGHKSRLRVFIFGSLASVRRMVRKGVRAERMPTTKGDAKQDRQDGAAVQHIQVWTLQLSDSPQKWKIVMLSQACLNKAFVDCRDKRRDTTKGKDLIN